MCGFAFVVEEHSFFGVPTTPRRRRLAMCLEQSYLLGPKLSAPTLLATPFEGASF